MRTLLRTLLGLVIALLALLGGGGERRQGSRTKLMLKTALATVIGILVLLGAGGLALMYSGFYNIAANEPHAAAVRWVLTTGRDRAVQFYSRNIEAPPLDDPELVKQGLIQYRDKCAPCHGAPGAPRDQLGRGINPSPPPLMRAVARWTDPQLYWILTNGLKLSGMPAFGVRLTERDRWAVVAFATRMAWLSPADYRQFVAALEPGAAAQPDNWVLKDDQGLSRLEAEGNPELGRELMGRFGCTSCHSIPGRELATVGPPLTDFVERQFIAGSIVNTPRNLQAWIMNPQQFEPRTAMPNVGASPEQALHMAAYLYTLGDPHRLWRLRRKPAASTRRLRVCADPNNLPFSNERLEGFENRIAEVIARDLDASVEYTWRAQRRGFVRETLREGRCDVILGLPGGFELAALTRPYYRSTYVFVYRKDRGFRIRSFDDPILRKLKVGVHVIGDDYTNTPPAHALTKRKITGIAGYSIYGDYAQENPPARLLEAVAAGDVDVAIVWGPLAGYFASKQPVPLEIAPVSPAIDLPFLPFVFDISVGVRRGDDKLRIELETILERRAGEIRRILDEYGVPQLGPDARELK